MTHLRLMLCWLSLCTLALAGCASTAPASGDAGLPPIRDGTIARLKVDGPNAYINGRPVQGGSYVLDGDTVSTGPRTSAILILNDGGEIQLDENTDPLFKQGACLLMKIFHGRTVFRNIKCQEFEGVQMAGVAHSYVQIMSSENESRVTVIAGEVNMRSPSQATLGANEEYVATRAGAVQVLRLTAEEANARVAWTRNYFHPPAAQQSSGLSPVGAAALGIGIGVLLDNIFGKDKHSSGQQESSQGQEKQGQTDANGTKPVPGKADVPIIEEKEPGSPLRR